MLFAMMQEQHSEQMNQMREQNKAALDMAQQGMREMAAMMKTMASSNNAVKVEPKSAASYGSWYAHVPKGLVCKAHKRYVPQPWFPLPHTVGSG